MMKWKQHESENVVCEAALHDGEGIVVRRRFFEDTSKLPVRIEIWELPPGTSEGSHIHEGEDALEEFYYFIAGQGVMWMDGEEIPVSTGDAIIAPPGVDHGFKSTGEEKLKLVIAWGRPT